MIASKGCLVLPIGGQDRVMWFDATFTQNLFEQIPLEEFDEQMQKQPYRLVPLVVFAALKAGDDNDELPADFSEKMASRWLMGLNPEQTDEIVKTMQVSLALVLSTLRKAQAPEPVPTPPAKGKVVAKLN